MEVIMTEFVLSTSLSPSSSHPPPPPPPFAFLYKKSNKAASPTLTPHLQMNIDTRTKAEVMVTRREMWGERE